MRRRCGHGEDGYILLALLAASAVMIAGLALAIPRMAMQAQRTRDQLLIERGEDYRRGIELYYREHGKYPQEVEDLEETDGVRYLRKLSDDPMGDTGEWRLIHMGTDGRFEDSLLFDTEEQRRQEQEMAAAAASLARSSSVGTAVESVGMAQTGLQKGQQQVQQYPAASDSAPKPGDPFSTDPLQRVLAERQSAAPDLAEATRYSQGFQFDSSAPAVEDTEDKEFAGQSDAGSLDPGEQFQDPGFPSPPGMPTPGGGLAPLTGQIRSPLGSAIRERFGTTGPSADPAAAVRGSGARELVNQLLTTPRQGGLAGMTTASPAGAVQPQVFERGIAGVASKSTKTGVMVYKEKSTYNEWEFVFDYREAQGEAPGQAQGMGAVPNPAARAITRESTKRRLSPTR